MLIFSSWERLQIRKGLSAVPSPLLKPLSSGSEQIGAGELERTWGWLAVGQGWQGSQGAVRVRALVVVLALGAG